RLMQALVTELAAVVAAVGSYRQAIDDFFATMPAAAWARTLPVGEHGVTVPTLWARLGDAPGRWESFRHLQAQAGMVPVTVRSGKLVVVQFRFACDKQLRYAVDQLAWLSLQRSERPVAKSGRLRHGDGGRPTGRPPPESIHVGLHEAAGRVKSCAAPCVSVGRVHFQ
ncbi:MAG: transposase, partial [Candidatus Rokubacteria bacterium]|nr:transposase [Candidatus Rokubacteria bacterium]